MNSRDYKIFREGHFYHIYNRGDNREKIFLDKQDYFNFIKRLAIVMGTIPIPNAGRRGALRLTIFPNNSFTILAYCLMPNHFHILIRQDKNHSIGQLMTRVCTSYAKYFNHKYKRVGNIFQDTFKAKLVDSDEYLTHLSSYIHNNATKPLEYKYSSIQDYLNPKRVSLKISDPSFVLDYFGQNKDRYIKFLKQFKKTEIMLQIGDLLFEE